VFAGSFLYCQARILRAAKGIPAWRAPLTPWLIGASGLLEGTGLMLLIHLAAGDAVPFTATAAYVGMALSAVTGVLWIAYRGGAARAGIPPLARRELTRVAPLVTIAGHGLPLAAFFMLAGSTPGSTAALVTSVLAGFGAVLGGAVWKFTLVTRASHQQGYAMPKLPRRGSGTRAAPYRAGVVKPAN